MKKLLVMMTAAVLGVSAWAEDAVFEKLDYSASSRAVDDTTIIGYSDDGEGTLETSATVNWWANGYANDAANYEQPATVKAGATEAAPKFLEIETDSNDPMLRTFNAVEKKIEGTETSYSYAPVALDAGNHGVFIDTKVKLTGAEEAPAAGANKLIVWLKAIPNEDDVPGTTNLMVTAGIDNGNGGIIPTNYVLSANVACDQWVRLTIRADKAGDNGTFKIYVNENLVTGTLEGDPSVTGVESFLSLTPGPDNQALSAAGFEGTGALEYVNLANAHNAPDFAKDPTTVAFTWDENVDTVVVKNADGDEIFTPTTEKNVFDVADPTATYTVAVTWKEGYRQPKQAFDVNGFATFVPATGSAEFTIAEFGAATVEVAAEVDRDEAWVTIGEADPVSYASLAEALVDIAANYSTASSIKIKLGEDVCTLEGTEYLKDIRGNQTIEIDLAGNSIICTANAANAYVFRNNAQMKITDSVGGGKMIAEHANLIFNGSTLTLDAVAAGKADITYTGAIVNECYFDDYEDLNEWVSGTLNILGGKFSEKVYTVTLDDLELDPEQEHILDGITLGTATAPLAWVDPVAPETFYTLVDATFAVTLNAAANTTLTAAPAGDVTYGTKVTITATANSGYKFETVPEDWTKVSDTELTKEIEVTEAVTVDGPAAVEAAEKTGFAIIIVKDETTTTNYYPTLDAAIAAAGTGDPALPTTVTLLADAEIPAFISITKDVTVDLNGFTLARANDEAKGQTLFEISEGAKLTVNGTVEGSKAYGRLATVGKQWQSDGKTKDNPGKLEVNGGTYVAGAAQTVIHVNGDCTNCEVTINDATIESTGDNGVQFNGKGTYAINNSSITGATAIYMKGGTLTIDKDSTITANKATWTAPVANRNGSNATGDAIVMDSNKAYKGDIALTIADGATVTSAAGSAVRETITDADASTTVKIAVPTTLSVALTDSFADKVAAGDAELPGFVAVVGATPYTTLAAAFDAVTDGGTVALLANYTIPEAITVEKATTEGITLDLGGKTLTGSIATALKITGATTKLTIANGEYVSNADNALKVENDAEVTIAANATITGTDSVQVHKTAATTLNVYGSIKTADGLIGYGGVINVYDGASIQISGSENAGVYLYDASATLNVYGGAIESAVAIHDWYGTATINFQGGVISGRLKNCKVTVCLTDSCETLFSDAAVNPDDVSWTKVADLCAEGYEPQLVGAGEYAAYYQIAIKKFNVTFKADGSADIVSNDVAYGTAFADVKPEDPTAPEFKSFKGWTPVVTTIDGTKLVFTAEFTNNVYAITFAANGGSGTQTAIEYEVGGEAKTAPECTFTAPDNGKFNCWSNVVNNATYKVGETLPTNVESYELVADWTIEEETEDWDHPAVLIVENVTTAGEAWPSLANSNLSNAKASKLASWAKTYSVDFADASATIDEDAFLLNVANTEKAVEDAKKAFKIPAISIVGDEATVTPPEGEFNGTIKIMGSTTVDGKYDHEKKAGDQFFKAVLTF